MKVDFFFIFSSSPFSDAFLLFFLTFRERIEMKQKKRTFWNIFESFFDIFEGFLKFFGFF